jgi:multiple sugar transport system permease protein
MGFPRLQGKSNPGATIKVSPVAKFINRHSGALFVSPGLLILAGIVVVPVLIGLYLSFVRFNMLRPQLNNTFAGLKNYVQALQDPFFRRALANTIIWTFSNVVSYLIFGLIFALLLNLDIKGKAIYRSAVLVPWAMPAVVGALTWKWLLHPEFGLINAYAMRWGLISNPIPWLGEPGWAMFWIIVSRVWKELPFAIIVYLAALKTIPEDQYEAAQIDGANNWQQFLYITWPHLNPATVVITIITAIGAFNSFNTIWMMTQGGPLRSTEILATLVYKTAFETYQFGTAAAQAVLMVAILTVMITFYLRKVEKGGMAS